MKPGSAGGFVGPGKAAATGQPVVGPGFGPGGANATAGAADVLMTMQERHKCARLASPP